MDGKIVTPGDHTDSTLHRVITLADDDPEIMPPKGEPLTKEQTDTIKRWILEGAGKEPAQQAADINAKPIVQEIV